jgi:hypothetical protein
MIRSSGPGRIRIAIGCAAAALCLAAPCRAASELLQRLSLEAEGGYAFPQGNLEPVLDPSPDFGLRVTSSYYGPFQAHVRLHAGRMTGGNGPVPVLCAAGGAGLEWRGTRMYLPGLGLGVSLNYGRVSRDDVPAGRSFFMEDGESEFGFYPFLRWHIPVRRAFFLVGEIRNDVMLTEPGYSRIISTVIGAGWQWK